MKLSISTRIAEGFLSKEQASMPLAALADLAVDAGFAAICMRASQVGVQSPPAAVQAARRTLDEHGLEVSMVTGDFDVVYNNDRGPQCLRNIEPYLDLANRLGAGMIRVCLRTEHDIAVARTAAERAADRGITLVHQCHAQSLFETVDGIEATLRAIDHPSFGLIFEAANLEECGQSYDVETMRRLAPWIRNVYLQNQRFTPDGAITLNTWCRGPVAFDLIPIPASGGIDFPMVFRGLREIGYDRVVTVHQAAMDDGVTSPQLAATETAKYLRQLDAEVHGF